MAAEQRIKAATAARPQCRRSSGERGAEIGRAWALVGPKELTGVLGGGGEDRRRAGGLDRRRRGEVVVAAVLERRRAQVSDVEG